MNIDLNVKDCGADLTCHRCGLPGTDKYHVWPIGGDEGNIRHGSYFDCIYALQNEVESLKDKIDGLIDDNAQLKGA